MTRFTKPVSLDTDARLFMSRWLLNLRSFGLRTNFIDEGSFKARVLASDEKFPDFDFDIRSIEVPVRARTQRDVLHLEASVVCVYSCRAMHVGYANIAGTLYN